MLRDWLGRAIWFSLVGPKLQVRTKVREAVSYILIKSWPFGADQYCMASEIVARASGLTSYKSGLQQAGFLVCLL